ncbi:MAG: BCCT family transporter [Clostridia bacterium]|nr:BCCT family transporter [Clostridia bacterium]
MKKPSVDWQVFWPAVIVLLGIAIPLGINPEAGGKVVNSMLAFITGQFGWLFLIFALGIFGFLVWLACGRYANVKLGGPDDEPEFSGFAWVGMLFCAGIGSSLIYWSVVEPLYYLSGPPFGIEPFSDMAAEWAGVYGAFHWGFTAWAIYTIPTIPIAYALYVRKIPRLRLSAACSGVIGEKHANGLFGKIIDVLVMFGIVGGVGTSLGLGVPMLSSIAGAVFGIPESFGLQVGVIIVWTIIFGTSVYLGLYKGIAKLSEINIVVVVILAAFILIVGPTMFILNHFTNSMSLLFDNFFRMSLWTDPVSGGGFPQGWTVFYWAWWVAYAPMMGLFVARISKGRTLRELVVAECVWGTLGCWVYFAVLGGYTIHLELNKIVPVSSILSESGGPAAIVAVVSSLPGGQIVLPLVGIVLFIFLATTLDSSAYVLASIATKDLDLDGQPPRWFRVTWALIIAAVAVALLAVGGLDAVQISSVVVALPLVPILLLMTFSFTKWLKEDHGAALTPPKRGHVHNTQENNSINA